MNHHPDTCACITCDPEWWAEIVRHGLWNEAA
ncbi:hypothetical protein ABH922_003028 [Rhodococcus sp. 27YEA15]